MLKKYEQVAQELQPHLQEFENYRTQMLAKTLERKLLIVAYIVFILIATLVIVTQNISLPIPFPFLGIIVAVIFVVFVVYHQSAVLDYRGEFKSKIIDAMIKAINPELNYAKDYCISQKEFYESGIFTTSIDRYNGEDWVKGRIGETDFEFSEIHAEHKSQRRDSKGNTKTTYHTIFKGLFMKADFHKHFSGETYVLTDTAERYFGFIGKAMQKVSTRGHLVYLENPLFEKEFAVYSTDEVEARYLLSLNMLERILELKQKFDTNVQLSFVDTDIHIAISNLDILEIKMKQSLLDQAPILRCYTELCMCFDIINDLNLNTRIWTK
ncbi:MAG: DUF3137 domain-containing protein [Chitinophagales bacterium]